MQIYNQFGIKIHGAPLSPALMVGEAVGSYLQHFASTPPANYLVADGRAVSRTTYAALFAVIGTVFGAGDGTTTFNLPNMLGIFARGWNGSGSGIDSGRVFGSQQLDDLKAHTHYYQAINGIGGGNLNLTTSGPVAEHGLQTGSAGGTETRPINIAVLPCIKYQMGDGSSGTGMVNLAADYLWTGKHTFNPSTAGTTLNVGSIDRAWTASYKVIDLGAHTALGDSGDGNTHLVSNAYNNGTIWAAKSTKPSSLIALTADGSLQFLTAPAVAVGAQVAWVVPMTISNVGNVVINAPLTGAPLTINGPACITPANLTRPYVDVPSVAASGSSVQFLIPAWVTRIRVKIFGLTGGANLPLVQLGSGGVLVTAGYYTIASYISGSACAEGVNATNNGFFITSTPYAGAIRSGHVDLSLHTASNNTWVATSTVADEATTGSITFCYGRKNLPGPIDRIMVATADAFTGGFVGIQYS